MSETTIQPGLRPLRAWEINKASMDDPMGVRVELPNDVAENVISLQDYVYDIRNTNPDNFSAAAVMTGAKWSKKANDPVNPDTYDYALPDRDLPWLTPGSMCAILGNIAAGLGPDNLRYGFTPVKSTGISVAVNRCISYFPGENRNSLVYADIDAIMQSFRTWRKEHSAYDNGPRLVQLRPKEISATEA
ncbi:MAG: hypothetical protein ABWX94_02615 [Candidatus Saccharimonadales bacterium]